MLGQLHAALSAFGALAEPVGLLALTAFVAAIAADALDNDHARQLYVVAWVFFGALWLTLIYPFFVHDQSVIRGVGAIIAAPLSVLAAKVMYEDQRDLYTLSRAVAMMALIYTPVVLIPPVREWFILLVTDQTAWLMSVVGYEPTVVTTLSEVGVEREIQGKEEMYRNTFVFFYGGEAITYSIIADCTGIGSMAVIAGLIGSVRSSLQRKLKAAALTLPIIYVLNLVRNVFISVSFGHQYMDFFPDLTIALFSIGHPYRVSYIWADRILAQSASVVAMLLITWLLLRTLPEVMEPLEEFLYLLTGNEYDLAGALAVGPEDTAAGTAD